MEDTTFAFIIGFLLGILIVIVLGLIWIWRMNGSGIGIIH